MSAQLPPDEDAQDFAALTRELEGYRWRPEVEVEAIPSPQRIAPFSTAIAADVISEGAELGNGRLVLLHDPHGVEAWEGVHRFVTFARAEVDFSMVTDPLLADVGWSWLMDALQGHDARFAAASGTVTAVSSRCFGQMQDDPDRAEVEIRASWTPLLDQQSGACPLSPHLAAWQDLLCTTAGLPAVPAGIVLLGSRTGRNR
ncbi:MULTISPECIES: DUF3000 domain-containing protein [unclassified Luteococcus]|uniref:DUF3000 domain-containing protein n=1 Tax=unclassified Luteococcus TaxID=2639923 RepID=UPI00313F0296